MTSHGGPVTSHRSPIIADYSRIADLASDYARIADLAGLVACFLATRCIPVGTHNLSCPRSFATASPYYYESFATYSVLRPGGRR